MAGLAPNAAAPHPEDDLNAPHAITQAAHGMERIVPVEKQAYRDAMARLGAAVNVITTDGPGGKAGFTASAVTSVTDTPPTLLVCANRNNDSYPAFRANNVLCVNTLTPAQEGLSPIFAGMTQHTAEQRFEQHDWHTLETGAPVLDKAVVVFDCRIDQVVEVGTHDVFFCSVEAVRTGPHHEGLIYYGRGYHKVAAG
jgi:flavin reductase